MTVTRNWYTSTAKCSVSWRYSQSVLHTVTDVLWNLLLSCLSWATCPSHHITTKRNDMWRTWHEMVVAYFTWRRCVELHLHFAILLQAQLTFSPAAAAGAERRRWPFLGYCAVESGTAVATRIFGECLYLGLETLCHVNFLSHFTVDSSLSRALVVDSLI
jgi:hypothetical protein